MTSKAITSFNKTIRQDENGRYCLNDLHKAAMDNGFATENHRPGVFLKSSQAKAFVALVDCDTPTGESVKAIKGGNNQGTYATKTVAIECYRWIFGAQAAVKLCEKIADLDALVEALDSFEVPDDLPDMYVYAIRETETGRVKLGISKDPESRLKQLQTGNSQQLELVAYKKAENGYQDERAAHLLNSASHVRGERFDAGVSIQ